MLAYIAAPWILWVISHHIWLYSLHLRDIPSGNAGNAHHFHIISPYHIHHRKKSYGLPSFSPVFPWVSYCDFGIYHESETSMFVELYGDLQIWIYLRYTQLIIHISYIYIYKIDIHRSLPFFQVLGLPKNPLDPPLDPGPTTASSRSWPPSHRATAWRGVATSCTTESPAPSMGCRHHRWLRVAVATRQRRWGK